MGMNRSLSSFAYIVALGTLADSLLSLVSLLTVSRLSTSAVAAIGLTSYLFFVINAASFIFSGGLAVVVSQAMGAGEEEVAERSASETVTLAFLSSLIALSSIPFWLKSYLKLVSMWNIEVVELSYQYASVRFASLPIILLSAALSAVYRGADEAWTPTIYSILSAIAGAILIPVLTLGFLNFPGVGLLGAGLGSVISSYIGSVAYVMRPPPLRIRVRKPGRLALRAMWVGLPMASERVISSIAQNIYVNAVARSGTKALAAHNIGLTVESVIIQPSFAVSIAALVKAGQSVGSSDDRKLDSVIKKGAVIGATWMGFASVVLIAVSPFVGGIFSPDPEVARLTTIYLMLAGASEVGLGVSQALLGAIRGMGSVWVPFALTSFSVVFLRALPAQALSLKYGAVGAWITQNSDMYGRVILSYITWRILGSRKLAKKVFV